MKPSVVCCFASFTLATPLPPPLQAQLLSHTTDAIPGRYIVKLKTGVSALNLPDVLKLTSHEPGHIYIKGGLIGFAAELDDEEVTSLYNHPDVSIHCQDNLSRFANSSQRSKLLRLTLA